MGKQKFIITSIESGKILAREKNPRQADGFVYSSEITDWQKIESSLKTFPLSEESRKKLIHGEVFYNEEIEIGQEIEGDVVNGEIVIK